MRRALIPLARCCQYEEDALTPENTWKACLQCAWQSITTVGASTSQPHPPYAAAPRPAPSLPTPPPSLLRLRHDSDQRDCSQRRVRHGGHLIDGVRRDRGWDLLSGTRHMPPCVLLLTTTAQQLALRSAPVYGTGTVRLLIRSITSLPACHTEIIQRVEQGAAHPTLFACLHLPPTGAANHLRRTRCPQAALALAPRALALATRPPRDF